MVVNDIIIRRLIFVAMFTTEGALVTEHVFMFQEFASYNDVITIAALDFSELTAL